MDYFEIPIAKLPHRNVADVLIVTATKVETERLHNRFEAICDQGILKVKTGNQIYFLGKLNGYNIVHCQCGSMGTQGEKSSILTVKDALLTWPEVKCVIMVGIAFGMYDDEGQHYSDVLVSTKIFPYENQRLNKDDSVDYRGEPIYACQKLIDAFNVVAANWAWKNTNDESTKIEVCPILSGEKLVDNLRHRNKLKTAFPEYRGGEMEGIGVASVCTGENKSWILLKGICDFADGNKREYKKQKQSDAADAAVRACYLAFGTDNFASLIGDKIKFQYQHDEIDLSKVFFIHYDLECEPYYLVRKIDNEIFPFIKKKSCWVYGTSGMGKSELLTRNILFNGLNVISVDLSLCSRLDVDNAFTKIYERICDYFEVNSAKNLNYEQTVEAISKILKERFDNDSIYLLIDEIPYSNGKILSDFVEKICSMINFIKRNYRTIHVYFMLSSIVSPLKILGDANVINKYNQLIKFIEVNDWSHEECMNLIKMLTACSGLTITEDICDKLIKRVKFNPREIKTALHDARAIDIFDIDESALNLIL